MKFFIYCPDLVEATSLVSLLTAHIRQQVHPPYLEFSRQYLVCGIYTPERSINLEYITNSDFLKWLIRLPGPISLRSSQLNFRFETNSINIREGSISPIRAPSHNDLSLCCITRSNLPQMTHFLSAKFSLLK